MKNKTVDFNAVLKAANFLIGVLLLVTFSHTHGNEYVDETTIGLAILLCVQTHIALLIERTRRDPFVILLAFDTIFFFALRIVTLAIYPFSIAFDRYGFDAGDSNYALVFILVANTILYAGLYVAGSASTQTIDAVGWRARSPGRVVILMIAALVFTYFSESYWNPDTIPRVLFFLVIFLTPTITLLMSLTYYQLYRNTIARKIAVAIAALIVGEAVIHTLSGSRGAIIVIIQYVIVVTLAMVGCIRLKRKYLVTGIVSLPLVAVLLIATFAISTYNRAYKDTGKPFDLGRAIELASDAGSQLSIGSDLDLLIPPIASRAGYFDFSAEIIADRDKYAPVFTLSSYARSIVDNILTPGFDVFDQPKIANALRFFYQGLGAPSKAFITAENYQSDQLGIYGELYGLFGYASLPLFFLMAFAFKRVYAGLANRNPFGFAMKRAIVLLAYVWTIDSYGVDWTILEILPLVAALYIYAPFFPSKPVTVTESERVPGNLLANGSLLTAEPQRRY